MVIMSFWVKKMMRTVKRNIHSTGADTRYSALFVLNDNGRAIQGSGGAGFPGVSGFSENASGMMGTSTNSDGVLGVGTYGVTGWGHSAGLDSI